MAQVSRLLRVAALLVLAACKKDSKDSSSPPTVASVVVTAPGTTLKAGQTMQLTAVVLDQRGRPITGQGLTWSTSNESVATVSPSGLVTGASEGPVTITATVAGKSGTAALTVAWPVPDVLGVYAISGTIDLEPASSISGTLTISEENRLTGAIAGTMTITLSGGHSGTSVGTLSDAAVTEAGAIAFTLSDLTPAPSEGAVWRFTGTRSGTTFSGTHTLAGTSATGEPTSNSGPWTGVKETASRFSSGAPGVR